MSAPPAAPLIVPLLVSFPIVPLFSTPPPPVPPKWVSPAPWAPPAIVPMLVSVAIVPGIHTPPTQPERPEPPAPPVITPLLVSVVIVPGFDTPAPPKASTAAAAGDRAAVGERRDHAEVHHAPARRRFRL